MILFVVIFFIFDVLTSTECHHNVLCNGNLRIIYWVKGSQRVNLCSTHPEVPGNSEISSSISLQSVIRQTSNFALIYRLQPTNSMEQSPSRKISSQEIIHFLLNPEPHCRILSKKNPVLILTLYSRRIHFDSILLSTPMCPRLSLPLGFLITVTYVVISPCMLQVRPISSSFI
jgi:hypothetical protein